MNNRNTPTLGGRHWPQIRLVRLWDLLDEANDWNALYDQFIVHAFDDKFSLYFEVRDGYEAVMSHDQVLLPGWGLPDSTPQPPPLPLPGCSFPNVSHVRVPPSVAREHLKLRRHGDFIGPPLEAHEFDGGLLTPDVTTAARSFDVLPRTAHLHLVLKDRLSGRGMEIVTFTLPEAYVDERVCDEILPYLKSDPRTAAAGSSTARVSDASTDTPDQPPPPVAFPTSVIDREAGTELQRSLAVTSREHDTSDTDNDPFNLRDRARAVYALYQVARQCSQDERANGNASVWSSAAKRRLLDVAGASGGLRTLFVRKKKPDALTGHGEQALKLISPYRNPKLGTKATQKREWPTAAAHERLVAPSATRDPFVTDTLYLVIEATREWLEHAASGYGSQTNLRKLDTILTKYGLTLSSERKALFPIITYNGTRSWSAPERSEPATSRGQMPAAARASQHRGR